MSEGLKEAKNRKIHMTNRTVCCDMMKKPIVKEGQKNVMTRSLEEVVEWVEIETMRRTN